MYSKIEVKVLLCPYLSSICVIVIKTLIKYELAFVAAVDSVVRQVKCIYMLSRFFLEGALYASVENLASPSLFE